MDICHKICDFKSPKTGLCHVLTHVFQKRENLLKSCLQNFDCWILSLPKCTCMQLCHNMHHIKLELARGKGFSICLWGSISMKKQNYISIRTNFVQFSQHIVHKNCPSVLVPIQLEPSHPSILVEEGTLNTVSYIG